MIIHTGVRERRKKRASSWYIIDQRPILWVVKSHSYGPAAGRRGQIGCEAGEGRRCKRGRAGRGRAWSAAKNDIEHETRLQTRVSDREMIRRITDRLGVWVEAVVVFSVLFFSGSFVAHIALDVLAVST